MLMSRDNSKTSTIKLCFSVTVDDVFSLFGTSFRKWICIIMKARQRKAVCFLWTGRQTMSLFKPKKSFHL